jgi:hypothetical protein
MPAPALSDECMVLYAGVIDASEVKTRAGPAEEQEDIVPLRISIDVAIGMLAHGGVHNSVANIALRWLALSRGALPEMCGRAQQCSVPG